MRALPLLIALCMLAVPMGASAVAPDVGPSGAEVIGGATSDASASDRLIGATQDDALEETRGAHEGTHDAANETQEEPPRYRMLTIPAEQRQRAGVDRQGADVGPTLQLAVDETSARMETVAVRDHVEAAETNDERQRRIIAAISEIEQAEVTLHQRQRNAIRQHGDDELSDRELLNVLASTAMEARVLQERLTVLGRLAEETEDFGRESQLNELEFRLHAYDGPVRTYAVGVANGDRSADRFYVESGEDAVVVSVVHDGQYVRESFDGERWARDGSTFATADDGVNVTATAYPKLWEARSEASSLEYAGVSRVDVRFPEGELRTFNSAGSERVFKEHQFRLLDQFEHDEDHQRTRDGFNVTVHSTYRGGPVQVVVRTEEDGNPVRGATVRVGVGDDSEVIGQTNADGVLWTVSPTESYHVTVLGEDAVVPIDGIEPTDPPSIDDDTTGSDDKDGDGDSDGGDNDSDDSGGE